MSAPQTFELAGDGFVELYARWLPANDAARAMTQLLAEVPWQSKAIRLFGKEVMQPRLVAWIGDPEAVYTYSNTRHEPLPWTPTLMTLRAAVEQTTDARYNAVLANLYRNERDSMGFHADAEPELGEEPVIASVSLGETRRFRMRYVGETSNVANVELPLEDGSLLVMRKKTQRFWRHAIPKETRARGPRINLTFRWIEPSR